MPFVRVEKLRAGIGGKNQGVVRMGSHLQSNRHKRGIYINIAHDLVEQLGWTILTPTETRQQVLIDFLEGTGEDAGFLQIAPTQGDKPYVLGSERKSTHAWVMTIGASTLQHYVLNEVPVPVESVEFSIDNGVILIVAPDWLRYNPQSVSEPKKAEVKKEAPRPTKPQSTNAVDEETQTTRRLSRQERRVLPRHIVRGS